MVRIFRRAHAPTKGKAGYIAEYVADITLQKNVDSAGFILVQIPSKTRTVPHAHTELQEIFVTLNRTKIGVGSQVFELEKGDIVIVDPSESHYFLTYDEQVTIIAIKIPNLKDDKVQVI
ncbi:MAG: hypothetical protein GF411_03555 [Candidatus Lokiarchaeota archaeon]|nr:hypothetical protein [Candidatus Lokiarchaeota archaeon]